MIHQLRVTLNGLEPEIWRVFKVNSDITFHDLHLIIQITMGWENDHLYEFENKDFRIGLEPEDDFFADDKLISSNSIKIREVLQRKRSHINYTYDFGDSWEHKIVVENIFKEETILHPICLSGAMNCPPEDCGGVWAYMDLIEIIGNKKHPEYRGIMEWLGGSFNPKQFDIDLINNRLAKLKSKRNKK